MPSQQRVAGGGEARTGHTVTGRIIAVTRVNEGSADVMVAEPVRIGEDVVEDPVPPLAFGNGAVGVLEAVMLGGLAYSFDVKFTEQLDIVVLVAETHVGGVALTVGCIDAEVETVDPGAVELDVSSEVEVLVAVLFLTAVFYVPKGIVPVLGDTVRRVAEPPVGEGGHTVGGHTVQVVADRSAVGVVQGVGERHVDADLDVFGNRRGEVDRCVVAHEVVADDITLLVCAAEADEVVRVGGAAGEVEVVVLAPAGLEAHVIPVGDESGLVLLLLHVGHEIEVVIVGGLAGPGVPEDDVILGAQHFGHVGRT